ncbi:hypothetical protein BH10BAC2_BH10BAC2_11180 [soil metagenome]
MKFTLLYENIPDGADDASQEKIIEYTMEKLPYIWSEKGKLYQKIENYCYDNPGTFCVLKPVYQDQSVYPILCGYGTLTAEKNFGLSNSIIAFGIRGKL